MKPGPKRVLVHATLTALVLAGVGYMFVEIASGFAEAQITRPGSAELNPGLPDGARLRVPLMMALWGFAFVCVGELVVARFRRAKAEPAPTDPGADAEKLLNDLLAKAEAERAGPPPNPAPPVS